MAEKVYYQRAAGVAISELDTLMPGDHLLVLTSAKRFQVAGLTRDVILSLEDEPLELWQLESTLKERGVQLETPRLKRVLEGLEKLALVTTNYTPPAAIAKNRRHLQDYLTLKVPLLPAERIAPLTRRLGVLFNERWMFWLMPALLVIQAWFCLVYQAPLLHAVPSFGPKAFGVLICGNYLALVMHELGHASACAAKGISHGPIGFCIYLIYPAFYADVTNIWKLPRRERAVVDGAGIYVSLICALAFSATFFASRHPVFGVLAILCDITVFFNLNPFIRMDGYWLVSDWLGVQNLMAINREVSWWAIRRMLGANVPGHTILSKEYKLRWFYVCYFFGFVVFFVYLAVQMSVHYIPQLLVSYPGLCLRLRAALVHPSGAGAGRDMFSWLIGTLTIVGLILLSGRLLQSSVHYFRRLGQAPSGRAAF